MVTIKWCGEQPRGIRLIAPNENLANEYLQAASESLDVLNAIEGKSKAWLATTKYYCEYFAVYAYLLAVGIRCEIHDCTIAVAELLEQEGFLPVGIGQRLKKDKQLRIDNQYYLKNQDVELDHDALVELILTMKERVLKLTQEKIERARACVEEKL